MGFGGLKGLGLKVAELGTTVRHCFDCCLGFRVWGLRKSFDKAWWELAGVLHHLE